MKKFLIFLQVLALIVLAMPATAQAQTDMDLDKLMKELKKEVDEQLDKIKKHIKESLQKLLEKYLKEGKETKPEPEKKVDYWIGFSAADTKDKSGILVTLVTPKSPADLAGIKVGDKITSFGKHIIRDLVGFKKILPGFKAGMRIGIGIKRGEQNIIATITLAKKPTAEEKPKGKPFLGVSIQQTPRGLMIAQIVPNGPANKAGIQVGDMIFALGEIEVKTLAELQAALAKFNVGQTITVVIVRNNKKFEHKLTLSKAPTQTQPEKPVEPEATGKPYLGVKVNEENGKVLITEVVKGGPAEAAGAKVGDQIFALGRSLITSTNGLVSAISKYKVGQTVALIVVRDSKRYMLRLKLQAMPGETVPEKVEPEKPKGKPFLGFSAMEKEDGVYISKLVENSPAAKAGFMVNDRLYYFGEIKVKTIEDIKKALTSRYYVGQEVGCVVFRGEERIVLELALMTRENWEAQNKPEPKKTNIWLGFSVTDTEDKTGIVITKVAKNGPADRIGLMTDDKIVSFNMKKITSRDELHGALSGMKLGARVPIAFFRGKISHVTYMMTITKEQGEKLVPITRRRAWIGISLDTTHQDAGIKVNIEENSAAHQIGLHVDDIIMSINGVTIKDRMHFAAIWKSIEPGSIIKLEVLRGDAEMKFELPTFMQPNREEIPLPPKPKVDQWSLPQLPGGLGIRERYTIMRLSRHAIEAMQTADYDEAIKYLEKILKVDPNNATAFYNIACIYALENKKKKALEYLKKSIVAGFVDWEHFQKDTDLDNMREMPEYKKMMADKKTLLKMVADMKLAELKEAYGEKFNYYVDMESMLIFATEHPEEILEDLKDKLVTYAKGQWDTLFDTKPDYFITIIIPTPASFDELIKNKFVGGFYSSQTRSLIAKELGHTLTHEFTHALHFVDIGKLGIYHNIWFVEGLATCFENSVMKDGIPTPVHNGRLYHLQMMLKKYPKNMPKFSQFMRLDRNNFMKIAGLAYAMSRYMTYWLWEQGKLKEYYDLYSKTFAKDPTGILAMQTMFKKSIDAIEADWKKWLQNLPDYMGFMNEERPFIGIMMKEIAGGVKITEVVEGAPSDKAGLKVGDIITHFDSTRIISINDISNVILTHKPDDEVEITVKRTIETKENGEVVKTEVKILKLKLKLVKRPKTPN
ncbi:MAG: PDZ domain-containing protein [Planctomycetes bacterium]|nr:PDZ domain-containing protein [Planctomycetota bacterium]